MSRVTRVIVTCDLADDGHGPDEPGSPARLSLDGTAYDLDLCPSHRAALDGLLAPYMRAALVREGYTRRASPVKAGLVAAAVREWAAANGIKVNTRGRLPLDVLDAYARR